MKIPPLSRFLSEDFGKEQQSWIGRLLFPLNQLLNTIYSAFSNGLTFQDNFLAQVKVLQVSGSSPKTSFQWRFQSKPIGVLILSAVVTPTPIPITSAVTCDWSYSNGTVSINNITGLTAGSTYTVTFLAIGG